MAYMSPLSPTKLRPCSCHVYMVLFLTHIPFVVDRAFNATPTERLQHRYESRSLRWSVKSFSDLYTQTQALLLMVVAMLKLKVMKQRCHFSICLSFTLETTRNFSKAMAWMCGWSFPLCGNLPCVQVLHFNFQVTLKYFKAYKNNCLRVFVCVCVLWPILSETNIYNVRNIRLLLSTPLIFL